MTSLESRRDRIAGGLVGLLVGDALGVPYEFHPPATIPAPHLIKFAPPPGFQRAHARVPPGTWSDDGAQALCLLASLLHCDRLDANDLGARLLEWYAHGYMAVDGIVFDVGIQTGEALRRIAAGVDPLKAGGDAEHSKGNGSLMRVLPLALWHCGDDAALFVDAHANRASRTAMSRFRSAARSTACGRVAFSKARPIRGARQLPRCVPSTAAPVPMPIHSIGRSGPTPSVRSWGAAS